MNLKIKKGMGDSSTTVIDHKRRKAPEPRRGHGGEIMKCEECKNLDMDLAYQGDCRCVAEEGEVYPIIDCQRSDDYMKCKGEKFRNLCIEATA